MSNSDTSSSTTQSDTPLIRHSFLLSTISQPPPHVVEMPEEHGQQLISSVYSTYERMFDDQPDDQPPPSQATAHEEREEQTTQTEDCEGQHADQCKECRCAGSCACRNPLAFPRRVRALPPVRAAAWLYERVKASHGVLTCLLTSVEVSALVATAPARLAARPLRSALATPVYVADLLLCKGLDLAERLLPCIAQPPSRTVKAFALCACGVPAGACYLTTKMASKALRTCLCDVPAVACGIPASIGCSAAEVCFCDMPRAACHQPAAISAKAAQGTMRDMESVLKDVNLAAEFLAAQMRRKEKQ